LLGSKDFEFKYEWDGVGGINANAAIDLGPIINASGNMGLSGTFSPDCETGCISGSVSAALDVGAKAEGSGSVTVYTKCIPEEWDWFEWLHDLEFSVGFEAKGQATVGASGEASYYYGDGCTETSEIGCCKIGTLKLSASISFNVCRRSYEVGCKDPVTIWDGIDNGKCG